MSDSNGGLFLEIAVPRTQEVQRLVGSGMVSRVNAWREDTVGCVYVCVKPLSKQHTKGSQGHCVQCC